MHSVKHNVVLIPKSKPADQNSDLIEFTKQMNNLVSSGVVEPKICSIYCEGNNLHVYIMDLVSPKAKPIE